MRILLIEDDQHIGDGLWHGLKKNGFTVDWFQDGHEGQCALEHTPYDAVILDLGLPSIDGMDILFSWRQRHLNTPILILTARDALPNRVAGLNAGADDYLCKPFSLHEVVARLLALIRRSKGQSSATLCYGQLTLNTSTKTVFLHHTPLLLTQKEYLLVELFLLHPQQIFTRAQIEDKLYSWDQEVDSNAVEVHIHNIRKKINKSFVLTRRNLGYTLGDKP
ncbi:response regulator [Pelistega ratti]|uniref:response regulator n=1 Tax=Pelistega ratti TaxID=2652177 RepID=UPI0013589819|nr:response regulator [Pelistega ratti]